MYVCFHSNICTCSYYTVLTTSFKSTSFDSMSDQKVADDDLTPAILMVNTLEAYANSCTILQSVYKYIYIVFLCKCVSEYGLYYLFNSYRACILGLVAF